MVVFTPKPDKLRYLQETYPALRIRDFNDCMNNPHMQEVKRKIEERTEKKMLNLRYFMREHAHSFVSLVLPLADHFIDTDYILKMDADVMFAGRGFMEAVEAEIEPKYELYLVERTHKKMLIFQRKPFPGVGFTLWRRGGQFIPSYIENFEKSEQWTIASKIFPNKLPCKLIKKPGLHFVFPFRQNPNFSKEDLMEFLPAYIHLGGSDIIQKQVKIKGWEL
jgi:hypothetical protein